MPNEMEVALAKACSLEKEALRLKAIGDHHAYLAVMNMAWSHVEDAIHMETLMERKL